MVDTCDRSSNFKATCVNPNCDIVTHTDVSSDNRYKIFKIPGFAGLCSEIAPNKLCIGLFCLADEESCYNQ